MSELRKCCEYCEYYYAEYEIKCAECRHSKFLPTDHRNFEIAKELLEWKGVQNER
jgi:hypothetical protein